MPNEQSLIRPERPPSGEAARELTNVEADERAFEQSPESKETFLEEAAEAAPAAAPSQTAAPSPAKTGKPVKDETLVHVEKIMEEGLGTLYVTLPESARPLFKQKGEEAATEIATMVRSLKIHAGRVLRLLRDWLLTIPKVNRFFLEQEAKIKTDTVIQLAEATREELQTRP
ncbi:hypothetical protein HY479_02635 [Candidatus Uhrbacteria bacterium]|nr:hypothetical protein [Candidatus Uhrbacteria bacterium]